MLEQDTPTPLDRLPPCIVSQIERMMEFVAANPEGMTKELSELGQGQDASLFMVLLAAFIGERWRDTYETALKRGYRFLSFGDAMYAERN